MNPIARPSLDRYFWLAVVITALVVIPRSAMISRAHSPSCDDQFHLRRGLDYICGNPSGMLIPATDPPVGQGIMALPMVLTDSLPGNPIHWQTMPDPTKARVNIENQPSNPALAARLRAARRDVLYGHRLTVDILELLVAIWKAILFVPFAGLVFHWCRELYGLASGYLALGLLLVDPTFAAHIAIAAPDTLGVETILLSCYWIWRYVERPSFGRMLLATFAIAVAMLTKHTAAPLPIIALVYAAVFWFRERKTGDPIRWRTRIDQILIGALSLFFFIWALLKFDLSAPIDSVTHIWAQANSYSRWLFPVLTVPWPAGRYVGLLMEAVHENGPFRWAYLNGHAKVGGWWYYFPAIAAYKVPLGFFVIFVLAIFSLLWARPKWREMSLSLPLVIFCYIFFSSGTNVGFRHFLPAYIFILMLASRTFSTFPGLSVAEGVVIRSAFSIFIWLCVLGSWFHTLTFGPDYLSYVNWPYAKPWLRMNDSNIDWGQGLKQVRDYLDAHPTNQPIYIRYDWDADALQYYLRGRATAVGVFQAPPKHGLLIICPVWVAGYWDPADSYAFLRPCTPDAVIGHAMLVYDLDHLHK